MAARYYQDLAVWQKSMDLVEAIYRVSRQFPAEERFGLTDQVRRSAISIPANIAEGQGRLHQGDFRRFLSIARGSLMETETHIEVALRLRMIEHNEVQSIHGLIQDVGRLLNGLIRSMGTDAGK